MYVYVAVLQLLGIYQLSKREVDSDPTVRRDDLLKIFLLTSQIWMMGVHWTGRLVDFKRVNNFNEIERF